MNHFDAQKTKTGGANRAAPYRTTMLTRWRSGT